MSRRACDAIPGCSAWTNSICLMSHKISSHVLHKRGGITLPYARLLPVSRGAYASSLASPHAIPPLMCSRNSHPTHRDHREEIPAGCPVHADRPGPGVGRRGEIGQVQRPQPERRALPRLREGGGAPLFRPLGGRAALGALLRRQLQRSRCRAWPTGRSGTSRTSPAGSRRSGSGRASRNRDVSCRPPRTSTGGSSTPPTAGLPPAATPGT